ncbi:MAG: endolytic transglycosylase MltG [Bdellovibrionota bacterium]|nr:hypothetical protein [Pseudobdellovibrionaceae bacterium]
MKKIIVSLFLIFTMASAYVAYEAYCFLQIPPSQDDSSVYFEVKPGPFYKITSALKKEGLITNSKYFTALAKYESAIKKVKTGEYELRRNMKPSEVLNILVSGIMVQHSFTIQEGLNIYEIAELLASKNLIDENEFLRLAKSPSFIQSLLGQSLPSLEGYLFPDTYRITKYQGERNILKIMVERFHEVFASLERAPTNLSRHEIVTLASIIEKETGAPHERPLISSVFQNRLRKKMRIQSDPTILYGIKEKYGYWKKNIQKKDILEKTAYNTYKIPALPKGPISNPGRESLQSVFKPEKSEYLYFVSKNDGTHYFSKTYKEHQRAVRDFQLNYKARQGKSWRDLNKKK